MKLLYEKMGGAVEDFGGLGSKVQRRSDRVLALSTATRGERPTRNPENERQQARGMRDAHQPKHRRRGARSLSNNP